MMRTRLALWQPALRTDHLEKSLEAAVNAGYEDYGSDSTIGPGE